ncbi:uncharacterized protein LOC119084270 [Bradysia coprophila]|uniref:uncharacterized protein LOC119084270 n=1 Tax=Bradysia coprophila TaxID=38358 RepID=UPI00187DAB02|nr:uncharacterized protein LOC119084270 [Bradysia coprophila]XP_037050085.1 uncharacterized protein LOC119084270 [Bradysia coprophila]
MGYDLRRFVGEIEEEFVCSICRRVLEDPLQSKCEHMFCRECIQDWLSKNASCPDCRKKLTIDDMQAPGRIIRNLFNKLIIRCNFEDQGCRKMIMLEYLEDHGENCKFNPNNVVASGPPARYSENVADNVYYLDHLWRTGNFLDTSNFRPTNRVVEGSAQMAGTSSQAERGSSQVGEQSAQVEVNSAQLEENGACANPTNGRQQRRESVPVDRNNRPLAEQNRMHERNRMHEHRESLPVDRNNRPLAEYNRMNEHNRMHGQRVLQPNLIPDFDTRNNTGPPQWKLIYNMKVEVHVMEVKDECFNGLAQALSPTCPADPSFKVKLVDFDPLKYVAVGLGCVDHQREKIPGLFGKSIGFDSAGDVIYGGISTRLSPKWYDGDVIECGIRYPDNARNSTSVKVYFCRNGQLITEKKIPLPAGGYFPTMYSFEGIAGSWWDKGVIVVSSPDCRTRLVYFK